MNFLDERLPARFWAKVAPCPMTGCWLWLGGLNVKGYGAHKRRAAHSRSQLTHRFTYEAFVGPLPAGTEIDHRVCKTRSCCNPRHLEAVPHRVNVQRGAAKKTICIRGHALSGDNLRQTKAGARCATCVDIASAERARRKREAIAVRGPLPPRPRKTSGRCGRGHAMHFNGSRLVCQTCEHDRHERTRCRTK